MADPSTGVVILKTPSRIGTTITNAFSASKQQSIFRNKSSTRFYILLINTIFNLISARHT